MRSPTEGLRRSGIEWTQQITNAVKIVYAKPGVYWCGGIWYGTIRIAESYGGSISECRANSERKLLSLRSILGDEIDLAKKKLGV